MYCLGCDRLPVQAVVDMAKSDDDLGNFLKAWKQMKRYEATASEGTICVTIELPSWEATCQIVQMPWLAIRTTIAAFGQLPGLQEPMTNDEPRGEDGSR